MKHLKVKESDQLTYGTVSTCSEIHLAFVRALRERLTLLDSDLAATKQQGDVAAGFVAQTAASKIHKCLFVSASVVNKLRPVIGADQLVRVNCPNPV